MILFEFFITYCFRLDEIIALSWNNRYCDSYCMNHTKLRKSLDKIFGLFLRIMVDFEPNQTDSWSKVTDIRGIIILGPVRTCISLWIRKLFEWKNRAYADERLFRRSRHIKRLISLNKDQEQFFIDLFRIGNWVK